MGRLINAITSGDWEVSRIASLDEDNGKIYFGGKKESAIESNLYLVNIDGSEFKLISNNLGSHRSIFSPSNSYFIDYYSASNTPTEITLNNSDGSRVMALAVTDRS